MSQPSPPSGGGEPRPAWIFPFNPPSTPGPGDNQALAVNTTDDSSAYAPALSLVWVTDGHSVGNVNTAFAAASCANCRTVAIAFQAVFVIGYTQVVTPVNNAVAANYHCTTCITSAVALQLVATLTRQPSNDALKAITDVWTKLRQESAGLELRPVTEVYAELRAARTQLLGILVQDGDLAGGAGGASLSGQTKSATGSGSSTNTTATTGTTPTTAANDTTSTATVPTMAPSRDSQVPPSTTSTAPTTTVGTTAASATTPTTPTTTAPTTTSTTTTDPTATGSTTTTETTTSPLPATSP